MSGQVQLEKVAGAPAEAIPLSVRRRARRTGLSAALVLLTRDSATELEQSLEPLRQAAAAARAELLFVDLGSTDATREYASSAAPGARGVWLERDDRFADALAVTSAVLTADVVVFVSASVEPTGPDSVVRLLEHLEQTPPATAVVPLPDGVFAIRRTGLTEIIEGPDRPLENQADLLLELVLQGRQVHSVDGDYWRALLPAGNAADGQRSPAKPRTRPLVLHVAECFAAGTERHLLDLVRHIDEVEHVLAIPSHHHGRSTHRAAALAAEAGARVELVELSRSKAPHRQGLALAALRRLIQQLEPDVVHGHSSIGGAMARLAAAGLSVPVVYTPHAVSRARSALAVERLLRGRTDRVIAVSESERQFIVDQGVAHERQVVVIPNGVDLSSPPPPLHEPLRARLGISTDTPLFGCVGRLAWQKAPEIFVSACAIVSDRLPGAHFVLIGSGPLQKLVETAVAEAGLGDRFHLIPSLPDAAAALEELDVYALPSRFEGGPYTPVEAMRAGTPVVVTNVAGNRDIVEHWVSGLVVPQDEPHALASAMLTLLKDGSLRERLVKGAQDSLHRFEVRAMARATAAVYGEVFQTGSAALSQGSEDLRMLVHASLP
ncbi:MAG: glycosyltransferase [Solirubrobacteraceae bacterium]